MDWRICFRGDGMNLADSTAMRDFTANMRLVETFGNYCIANRPVWSRTSELQHKCDVGTITANETIELIALERLV